MAPNHLFSAWLANCSACGFFTRRRPRWRSIAALLALIIIPSLAWANAAPIDLAQTPMFSKIMTPPANVMILMDDSGSMTWEILVEGVVGGRILKPSDPSDGYAFIYDDAGGTAINVSGPDYDYLGEDGRKLWKSQYHGVNALYYNPAEEYDPWLGYGTVTFPNADPDKPRIHPIINDNKHLNLDETSFEIDKLKIPHAHYFEWSEQDNGPYLVVMDKQTGLTYYKVGVESQTDPLHDKVNLLTPVSQPPSDIVTGRSYAEELQNFANWFTYYRRREFTAKASLAKVLHTLESVRVGIYGINSKVVQTLKPIKITKNGQVEDKVDELIEALYDYVSWGGTPLNKGLDTIGKYFQTNDGKIGSQTGDKPYGSEDEGGACQQSFTIVFTDGYYTDPAAIKHGNIDGDGSDTHPYKKWGGGSHPYADNQSDMLADIAMYYYANDLQTNLDNKVPINEFDGANHQHMVTYAVTFGVKGSLNPADYDADFKDTNGNPIQWPAVTAGQTPQTIDDLWHATVNSRGEFFSAGNSPQLSKSLSEIMKAIVEIAKGSSASATVNGDWLFGKLGTDSYVYQPSFSNKDDEWTGDIKAYKLKADTGEVLANSVKWSAATELIGIAESQRVIATHNGLSGVPFNATALSNDQKLQLGADPAKMVEYLRGTEIQGYRQRTSKLGDFVNSRPVFVDETIYVGANDGMLHAFNAITGAERFAYIPNLVFADLKTLADPAYEHRFFVDLSPTVKKAVGIFGGTNTQTLLVGGLRGGGKGYFGLDVSNPANIVNENQLASRVKWEYPVGPDDDMGYSYSTPTIVQSYSSSHPWVVLFGNGYNSVNGSAVLYVINAANGDLVRKIDSKAAPVTSLDKANGLSTPIAIDVDVDQKVDFVYAGDLYGNLWKFDLTDPDPGNWSSAYGSVSNPDPLFQARGPSGQIQPITTKPDVMFHPEKNGLMVCFGTGKFLGDSDFSITAVQTVYGIWDYGDKIYDLKSETWSNDDDTEFLGAFDRSNGTLTNQNSNVSLLAQTFQEYSATIYGQATTARVFSEFKPDWITVPDTSDPSGQEEDLSTSVLNHAGYYIDLKIGERVVSDILIRGGILNVIGFMPDSDRCGTGGRSMFMELDVFNGGNLAKVQFDTNNDTRFDDYDKIDIGNNNLKNPSGFQLEGQVQPPAFLRIDKNRERLYMSSSGGQIYEFVQRAVKLGVTYWMQIFE